jgi:hypothetical protein
VKRFYAVVPALLTVFALSAVVRADDWRVTVTTGPETRTIVPLDSTSFLRLEDFTVSALAQVSSLSFNSSISELSFKATVSASAASTSGTNTNITLPACIVENQSLIVNVSVDDKGNGYMVFEPSTLGFVLSEGDHTVTLNICTDPPASVPEFSTSTTLTLLIMLTSFAVIILKRRSIW